MSSADRRKDQKARKERQQLKKKAQLQERQQAQQEIAVQLAVKTLSELVSSGKARIALTSFTRTRHVMAALWSGIGIRPQVCHARNEHGLVALCQAATQHVSLEEWTAFLREHLEAIQSVADFDFPISIIQWRPGEEPNISAAKEQTGP
jgi:hypothetical protein